MTNLRFVGSKIYGSGFILEPEEAHQLRDASPEHGQYIQALIGGDEFNVSPSQAPSRFVINFGQASVEEIATRAPRLLKLIRERVKPERDLARGNADGNHRKKYWWQFAQPRPELYDSIAGLPRCLASCGVTKHLTFAFQPTERVFSHTLSIFAFPTYTAFCVLQSDVHEVWARLHSSSLENRLRYTPSTCFDTFPFPQPDPRVVIPTLEDIGQRLSETRAKYMIDTDQGLTKTYNKLEDPACRDPEILELRRLHDELDRKVLDAYGWTDIVVPPYGSPTTDEDEIIDRLFVLNAERAAEEKRLGLVAKKTTSKKAKPEDSGQTSLL